MYSKAYLEQVLEPIIFPLFDRLRLEYIFIEDRSKVYIREGKITTAYSRDSWV